MTTSKISQIERVATDTMASVNLPWCVTQHGIRHVKRVVAYLEKLLLILPLHEEQKFVLRAATWLHDIGQSNFSVSEWDARENHHIYSREMVLARAATGELPLAETELADVAELVFRHNLETTLPEGHLRFLAIILRTADVMDITARRAFSNDAGVKWYQVRERLVRELPDRLSQWDHWAGHLAIDELELDWDASRHTLTFCFSVNDPELAEFQIRRFEQKITGIREYLKCAVRVTECADICRLSERTIAA